MAHGGNMGLGDFEHAVRFCDVAKPPPVYFSGRIRKLYFMSSDGMQICVSPALPDDCLDCLAGWLLRHRLDSEAELVDGVPSTLFFVEEDDNPYAEIDDNFIMYFKETSDDNPLKLALIKENETLEEEAGLVVGTEIDSSDLDVESIIQGTLVGSTTIRAVEVTVLYVAGIVRPGNIGGYCAYITADKIEATSFENWFVEQRKAS